MAHERRQCDPSQRQGVADVLHGQVVVCEQEYIVERRQEDRQDDTSRADRAKALDQLAKLVLVQLSVEKQNGRCEDGQNQ